MISSIDIWGGDGWRVRDCLCDAGPRDRPFVEQNPYVSVALVSSGTFTYRSTRGTVLLTPGSLLFCDAAVDFECRHEHGTGDRCVTFQYAPAFVESLAAALSLPRKPFSVYRVPMLENLVALQAEIQHQMRWPDSLRLEELALRLAEISLRANNAGSVSDTSAGADDVERTAVVARFIEERYAERLSLTRLAGLAGLSRFHLVRTFRKTAGMTPHQYLIRVRFGEAARGLRSTDLPVTRIAADAGFGDLSEFSRRFKRLFHASPATYRRSIRERTQPTGTAASL